MPFVPDKKSSFVPDSSRMSSFVPDKEQPKASFGGATKQFAIGATNQALLGFPLYALEKTKGLEAREKLESDVPMERIARGVGTTVGMVVGLPGVAYRAGVKGISMAGKAMLGIEKASRINRFVKSATKAGAGLGAFELASAPEKDFKEKIVSVPTSILFGSALGVAGESVAPAINRFLANKGLINKGKIAGTKELDKLNNVLNAGNVEESVKLKSTKLKNDIIVQLYDEKQPLRALQEAAEGFSGKSLKIEQKPYEAARLYSGVQGKIIDRFDNLTKIIEPQRKYIEPIQQIFTAERMIERSGRGMKNPHGITLEEAQKSLKDIEFAVGSDKYKELIGVTNNIRRNFTDNILRDLTDAGVLSEEGLNTILSKNQFYAPFEVLEYMEQNIQNLPIGKNSFSVSVPGFLKLAEGTEKDINNPLDALMRYTIRSTQLAEKNRVLRRIVDLKDTSESVGNIIKQVSSSEGIPKGFDKINLFRNGIKESYAVPQEISDVVKGLNNESVDLMTKMASASARALRVGATQLSLPFTVTNIIRDYQTAKIVSQVGFSVGDWIKGFATALRKGPEYKQFLRSGGSFSGFQGVIRRRVPSTVSELVPSVSRKAITYSNPFKWLSAISELSEQSTRLGVFTRGMRMGMNMEEAAYNARNATVDFSKMGTKMRVANMWVPFLNARLQGTVNILKTVKSDPKKFALISSGIIGLPTLSTYMWNTTQFPEVWDDIAEFEKNNNFIMITGREKDEQGRWLNVNKIPKGDLGRMVGNPIESFLEYLRGNDPDFSSLVLRTLSDISPVGFEREGKLSGDVAMSGVLPPFAKAPLESIFNRNLYTGRNIVPESLKEARPKEQYTEKTAPIAVQMGQLVGISPMKIESMAGTLFGTLGRQIINPFESQKTFSKRFVGAYGNAEQDNQFDILEDILNDSGDEYAKSLRLIRQSLIDFKEVPPAPELRKQFIKNRFAGNEKAMKKFIDLWQAEQNDELPIHRALKAASVKDRIRFIKEYASTLDSDEDKLLFLKAIIDNKVITSSSFERLK